MQAVTKQETLPDIMALTAILAKSDFLEGNMAEKAPIWIPMEPMLEKPQRAYVEMTTDLS